MNFDVSFKLKVKIYFSVYPFGVFDTAWTQKNISKVVTMTNGVRPFHLAQTAR